MTMRRSIGIVVLIDVVVLMWLLLTSLFRPGVGW